MTQDDKIVSLEGDSERRLPPTKGISSTLDGPESLY